jgi:hypothetical protein
MTGTDYLKAILRRFSDEFFSGTPQNLQWAPFAEQLGHMK